MSFSQENDFGGLFWEYVDSYKEWNEFANEARAGGEDLEAAFSCERGREIDERFDENRKKLRECLLERPGRPLLLPPGIRRDLAIKVLQPILEDLAEDENREAWLDEHWDTWTMAMLDCHDNVIDRLPRLVPLIVFRPIERSLMPCIGEALDAYFHGLDRACIALCRTVVESVLLQVLRRRRQNVFSQEDLEYLRRNKSWLTLYIKRAQEVGILTREMAVKAREIQKSVAKYIHQGDTHLTDEETLAILESTREIIGFVYGG